MQAGVRVQDEISDFTFKIILVGDMAVGKSCLLQRFSGDKFDGSYLTTIGVDFNVREIYLDNKRIVLQIWDTAGQERFKSITTAFYRGSDGIVVVYDVTNPESFLNLDSWLDEVERFASPSACKLVIGNKSDLTDKRLVAYHTAKEYADRRGIALLETSAKHSTNVNQAFISLAEKILTHKHSRQVVPSSESLHLGSSTEVSSHRDWPCC